MKRIALIGLVVTALLGACSENNPSGIHDGTLSMSFNGLGDLGADARYEGWVIVNGEPKSAGTFSVNGAGALSKEKLDVGVSELAAATAFMVTIEPFDDTDPAPSGTTIVAGDFLGDQAELSVAHRTAIGTTFLNASGGYTLASPTNGRDNNEFSGVWFLRNNEGERGPSLALPTLPAGWKYEGWAVIQGTPVSTGKFTSSSGMDESMTHSGSQSAPPFPGEDFLTNAPAGLAFPTNLSSQSIVITVEPEPDNSPNPFFMKPLSNIVPALSMTMIHYPLHTSIATLPTGLVTR